MKKSGEHSTAPMIDGNREILSNDNRENFEGECLSAWSKVLRERHTTARASRVAPKKMMQNNSNRVKKLMQNNQNRVKY